jgi:uncharacterized protein with NRDE domain
MCLLVVASRVVRDEPLLVGANRDEVLDRPTTAVTVLSLGPPRVLGGRDEQSGGTWLAVNEHGVCAGLTNQPLGDAKDLTRRSRGELPLALTRHRTASDAVAAFVSEYRPEDYNGAWLLVGDRVDLYFVDFTGAKTASVQALGPGVHVLENRPIGAASAKVDLVRGMLDPPRRGDDVIRSFRRALTDHRLPAGEDLPNAANCVHREGFGTRSSCLIRVPAQGLPRLWVADGPPCSTPYPEYTALWGDAAGHRSGDAR